MKKLLNLINFELQSMLKKLLFLCAGMIVIEVVSFLIITFNSKNHYLKFEQLLDKAGIPITFFIFLGLLMIAVSFNLYQNYFGSKSIYTLLTLPTKRSYVFLSKYITGLLCSIFLVSMQVAGIFITYGLYLFALPNIPKMNNALFLAFIRSDFLRILLPFDLISFIVSFICLNSLIVWTIYAVICERSRNYFWPVVLIIVLFRAYTLTVSMELKQMIDIFKFTGVILLATAMMIKYSIKAIKHSRIL